MKNKIISIIILLLLAIPVKAANYEIRELIPKDTETTIVTNIFSYRELYYDSKKTTDKKNYIIFKEIKNLSRDERPITISIGLFDKNKKNIGTINYCSTSAENTVIDQRKLKPQESTSFAIEVNKKYLTPKSKVKDIKYISILGDNKNCRITGNDEYIGQKIEEIGMAKNNTLDSYAKLLIKILSIIGVFVLALFVYRFLFTRSFENFDGDNVRVGYRKWNKDQQRKREEELRKNPPKPKEIKKTKTDEVLKQEQIEAQNEHKDETDLHNLYK